MKNLLIYITSPSYEVGYSTFVEYPDDLKQRINEINDRYKNDEYFSLEIVFCGEIHKEFKIVPEEIEVVKSLKLE